MRTCGGAVGGGAGGVGVFVAGDAVHVLRPDVADHLPLLDSVADADDEVGVAVTVRHLKRATTATARSA